MFGAPALAALAALRGGAGLVTLAVPVSVQKAAGTLCPCATSVPLPETKSGMIDPARARLKLEQYGATGSGGADVLIVGPGLGQSDRAHADAFWAMISILRQKSGAATVADADALNMLGEKASASGWETQSHPRTVITPHPGELARMHGVSAADVQADREGFALRTAQAMSGGKAEDEHPVVVLKGAGTIVTDGRRLYVNETGNPGMATGGSGDVLAGLIGALIAQGVSCFDAAVAGVYLHGLAGDLAARRFGEVSLIATDLIDMLPEAFQQSRSRGAGSEAECRTK